jgi:hypothetical protein
MKKKSDDTLAIAFFATKERQEKDDITVVILFVTT